MFIKKRCILVSVEWSQITSNKENVASVLFPASPNIRPLPYPLPVVE